MKTNWKFSITIVSCLAFAILLSSTGTAFAAPWENALQTVVTYMTGTTARLIAIIAVAAVGLLAMTGRMSHFTALSVIIGIAIVFGAPAIVDIFAR